MSDPPSTAATYERARRLANFWMWTIRLQSRRLQSNEPEDDVFALRPWADMDFLIIALTRLRRAAELAKGIPELKTTIADALGKFDAAVPKLRKMRNVAEHFDDYAVDEGRDRTVSRRSLEVSTITGDGKNFSWMGHELNTLDARRAAQELFDTIRKASENLGEA